jgi:hypothetical protein
MIDVDLRLTKSLQGDQLTELTSELVLESNDEAIRVISGEMFTSRFS